MNRITKKIIYIILILSIIKSILTLTIRTPTTYVDEYIYIKMAQSFFYELSIKLHGLPTAAYPPLYSIIASISFITNDVYMSYTIIKIINSFISSLIIIPSYFISKEFLDKKKSLIIGTIIGILPMNFVFAGIVMAENIFYTLFLTSLYFIYKSFSEKNYKNDILAGMFIGLTYLAKVSGISLIIIVIIMLLYKIKEGDFYEIKRKILMGLITTIIILPWLIRNAIMFSPTLNGILGGVYAGELIVPTPHYNLNLIYWIILYLAYILLASGFIVSITNLTNLRAKLQDKNMKILVLITLLTLLTIIIGGANHAAKGGIKEITNLSFLQGRPIGRYIDTVLPILFITSLISYYKFNEDKITQKKLMLLSIPLIIVGSQLLYFQLFPTNNISLTLIGITNIILSKLFSKELSILLITLSIIAIVCLCYKIKKTRFISLILIFCIITNLLGYSAIIYNAEVFWKDNSQINLSKWIDKNLESNKVILIDEEYCGDFSKYNEDSLCSAGKTIIPSSLWNLNPSKIGKIGEEATYIITKKELSEKLIKEDNGVKIYKIK